MSMYHAFFLIQRESCLNIIRAFVKPPILVLLISSEKKSKHTKNGALYFSCIMSRTTDNDNLKSCYMMRFMCFP